jgi:hypothetical protein
MERRLTMLSVKTSRNLAQQSPQQAEIRKRGHDVHLPRADCSGGIPLIYVCLHETNSSSSVLLEFCLGYGILLTG